MKKYKIKDIATEISVRVNEPSKSGYEIFVGLEHYISGDVKIVNYGSATKMDSVAKLFKKGDILIARRNVYLKRAGIVDFDGLTSGDSIVLRAANEHFQRLLPFIFNTSNFWDYATKHADGSMSKRLSPKILMEYEINLPDTYEDMDKLSNILWSMEDTVDAYKKILELSDELVKSQFIEMFGDPEKNEKQWDYTTLGDIAFVTKLAGFEYTKYINYKDSGDIIMIRGLNCKSSKLVLDDIYWIDQATSDLLPRSKLAKGDIVITYVGTVGEIALIDADNRYHLAPNVAKISLNDKGDCVPEFWAYMLMICRDYVVRFATSTTQSALNMDKIRKIGFIKPPRRLQLEFVELLQRSDKSKFLHFEQRFERRAA